MSGTNTTKAILEKQNNMVSVTARRVPANRRMTTYKPRVLLISPRTMRRRVAKKTAMTGRT